MMEEEQHHHASNHPNVDVVTHDKEGEDDDKKDIVAGLLAE